MKRETKIIISISVLFAYFLVEIVVGYLSQALSLVADAFHMISDVIALIIALYAINLTKRTERTSSQTYGFLRAEILGALVNGVFALALCFSLFLQCFERFLQPEIIHDPKLVLIVGSVGLLINILGMTFFHDHGSHSHSHSHSHDDKSTHEHKIDIESPKNLESSLPELNDTHKQYETDLPSVDIHSHSHGHSHGSLNMRGVFIHFLGDALGSVGVIANALVNLFVSPMSAEGGFTWVVYVDPVCTLVIVGILISTAWPLVSSAMSILLQNAPSNLNLTELKSKILQIPQVVNIHEFHIWQISETKLVASVHVLISHYPTNTNSQEVNNLKSDLCLVVSSIQKLLHDYGVHNTTVQPEFTIPKLNGVLDDSKVVATDLTRGTGGNSDNVEEIAVITVKEVEEEAVCMQKCPSLACVEQSCCPPNGK